MTIQPVEIFGTKIGPGYPPFYIAELSGNHQGNYPTMAKLAIKAHYAGANAIKLQMYTPEEMLGTVPAPKYAEKDGVLSPDYWTTWKGSRRGLHDLYEEAKTPRLWHLNLGRLADAVGFPIFTSTFSPEGVTWAEENLHPPAYKVASFEIADYPMLDAINLCQKPVILSTGMATHRDIGEAIEHLRDCPIILMHCVSSYPALGEDLNLRMIEAKKAEFGFPVGFSDHTEGSSWAYLARAAGADLFEKHVKLDGDDSSVDSGFSTPVGHFQLYVEGLNRVEASLGSSAHYGPVKNEGDSLQFQRSLRWVKSAKKGRYVQMDDIAIIRPGGGMHPRGYQWVIGRKTIRNVRTGDRVEETDFLKGAS